MFAQAARTGATTATQIDAIRNGGMAMLAYHYVRMFNDQPNETVLQQFRQYCRLDSAAMVMAYALMRDHVKGWRSE